MIVGIVLGFATGGLIELIRQRIVRPRKYKPAELNRYGDGFTLPAIDDPSWTFTRLAPCFDSMPCNRAKMTMGKIKCCIDHGVMIDTVSLDVSWPEEKAKFVAYAKAVRMVVLDRMVQESADMRWKRLESVVDNQSKKG